MPSILEGFLKQKIAAGFRGKLKRGVIRRETGASLNAAGHVVVGTPTTYTFEGIRENFDARYRAQAGIPETDVAILVLLGSVTPAATPKVGDLIQMDGVWHKVRVTLAIDPAGATWRGQCYEVGAP
jgi:hypothetical protein